MRLTILGCHSATPREAMHTTSQLLETKGHLFLIDCGEGTQIQLRKVKAKFSRIRHIFISHLHGDHFYGLIGIVNTFRLLGRVAPLHVYGPVGIKEIITLQLKLAGSWTDYPLFFYELSSMKSEVIFEDDLILVKTLPLNHRIYTNGFLFKTKIGQRNINKEAIKDYSLQPKDFKLLKDGQDIAFGGETISNAVLTLPPDPVKSYAFCSDTAYDESIIPLIHEVDLLYHESTFLEKHSDLARDTKHSTALQAAQIASKAKAKQLLLGHFSTRYKDRCEFIEESEPIFKNVQLAADLKSFFI